MAPQIPGLGWLGRRLESLMFGRYERSYRLFSRTVVAATLLLGLANLLVWLDVVSVAPGTAGLLETAGAVAVALFVLLGSFQLLVLARVLERESTNVATQAATLEARAGEVTETADELESTAETLETTADGLESRADRLESAAETLADTAAEVDAEFEGQTPAELTEQAADLREEAASLRAETEDAKAQSADAKAQTSDVKETTEQVGEEIAAERDRIPTDPDTEAVEEQSTDERDSDQRG